MILNDQPPDTGIDCNIKSKTETGKRKFKVKKKKKPRNTIQAYIHFKPIAQHSVRKYQVRGRGTAPVRARCGVRTAWKYETNPGSLTQSSLEVEYCPRVKSDSTFDLTCSHLVSFRSGAIEYFFHQQPVDVRAMLATHLFQHADFPKSMLQVKVDRRRVVDLSAHH